MTTELKCEDGKNLIDTMEDFCPRIKTEGRGKGNRPCITCRHILTWRVTTQRYSSRCGRHSWEIPDVQNMP